MGSTFPYVPENASPLQEADVGGHQASEADVLYRITGHIGVGDTL